MAYAKKIEIQVLAETSDEIGQRVKQWATLFTPWADISALYGEEFYAAAQVNSENTMKFRIRYSKILAGYLTSELRILYSNRIFDVKYIEDYHEKHLEFIIRAVGRNGEKAHE